MTSDSKILEMFSHPSIHKEVEAPTYKLIKAVHDKLNANAASITSDLEGREHGISKITLDPALYITITCRIFSSPPNFRPYIHIPNTANKAMVGALEEQHKNYLEQGKDFDQVAWLLKEQLVSAFDDIYLKELENFYTGLANILIIHAKIMELLPLQTLQKMMNKCKNDMIGMLILRHYLNRLRIQ